MYTCLESALQRRVNVRVCFKLYIIYGWIWTYKNDNVKHTRLATWSKSHCRPDCTWFTTIQKHTKIEAAFDCLSMSMYTAFGTVWSESWDSEISLGDLKIAKWMAPQKVLRNLSKTPFQTLFWPLSWYPPLWLLGPMVCVHSNIQFTRKIQLKPIIRYIYVLFEYVYLFCQYTWITHIV